MIPRILESGLTLILDWSGYVWFHASVFFSWYWWENSTGLVQDESKSAFEKSDQCIYILIFLGLEVTSVKALLMLGAQFKHSSQGTRFGPMAHQVTINRFTEYFYIFVNIIHFNAVKKTGVALYSLDIWLCCYECLECFKGIKEFGMLLVRELLRYRNIVEG